MCFVTIHLYVVMLNLIVNAVSGEIRDISSACSNNETMHFFLTNGAGDTDGITIKVNLRNPYMCASTFRVRKDFYISLIINVSGMNTNRHFCVLEDFRRSVFTVSDNNCNKEKKTYQNHEVYSKVVPNFTDVRLISTGELKSVLITATATRKSETLSCAEEEIGCIIESKYFCMTNFFTGDGIVRCDDKTLEYHDKRTAPLSKLVVLFTIAMIIATTWIIVSILRNIFPKRGRTFIYKIDENLTPYDIQFSSLKVEIIVVIIFARE